MYIISGQFRNYKIKTPKGLRTRPTASRVREALFNICQNRITDAVVLDLFAGSGALGLEALSRGAREVTFVEQNRSAVDALRANIEALGVHKECRVVVADAVSWIKGQTRQYDLIFADPPYGALLATQLAQTIDQKPQLLCCGADLFIEAGKRLPEEECVYTALVLKEQRKYGRTWIRRYARGD